RQRHPRTHSLSQYQSNKQANFCHSFILLSSIDSQYKRPIFWCPLWTYFLGLSTSIEYDNSRIKLLCSETITYSMPKRILRICALVLWLAFIVNSSLSMPLESCNFEKTSNLHLYVAQALAVRVISSSKGPVEQRIEFVRDCLHAESQLSIGNHR